MLASEEGVKYCHDMDIHVPRDYDQHYATPMQIRFLPDYRCDTEAHRIDVDDPVWGRFSVGDWAGDEIFTDLYTNPLVQRSIGIEQLTLPENFATMPGSTDMSRFEHLWGSVGFVRKVIAEERARGNTINDQDALQLQLRTFVSDLGHTAFSHLGDWLFQGYDGEEDQHDSELMELLEVGGVNEILQSYGIDPQDVVFPADIEDWVEAPQPDLCVDRVDYGYREIMRWVDGGIQPYSYEDMFQLDEENRLVMASESEAKRFGVAYMLLATEHWGHPVHRLQLKLFGELVRANIMESGIHPRDALYTVDQDILMSTRSGGELNYDLYALMLDTARAQRKIFTYGREHDVHQFMRDAQSESPQISFPDPLVAYSYKTKYSGVKPQNVAFEEVESADDVDSYDKQPHTLDVFLPAMKPRQIDPLYLDKNGTVQRLSENDNHYAQLLAEQKKIQSKSYVARVYADPDFLQSLKEKLHTVEEMWVAALRHNRLSAKARAENIHQAGMLAVGGSKYVHLID